jgi:uncharacterized repeat protein (TIGR04076 family)
MYPRLIVRVKEIRGNCVVYKGGEKFIIEGPELDLKRSDKVCVHALVPILHFAVALQYGVKPTQIGLAKNNKKAYIHCVDPGYPYTEGGEVIFEIELES